MSISTCLTWHVVAETLRSPDSSSGISDKQSVGSRVMTLRMGRKAVGPVRCVMHVKDPSNTYRSEKAFTQVFWQWLLNAPNNTLLTLKRCRNWVSKFNNLLPVVH